MYRTKVRAFMKANELSGALWDYYSNEDPNHLSEGLNQLEYTGITQANGSTFLILSTAYFGFAIKYNDIILIHGKSPKFIWFICFFIYLNIECNRSLFLFYLF